MTSTPAAPETTSGGAPEPVARYKQAVALVTYLILIAGLIIVIDVLHAAAGWQATAAVAVAGAGALILHWAFPGGINAVSAAVAVAGLIAAHSLLAQSSPLTAPARCPHTQEPEALVGVHDPVPQGHPSSMIAHIDNVIALDGSANVQKFETVCLTVSDSPAAGRQLWLIQRLRLQDDNGAYYDLFYVLGALPDPSPVRHYGVAVDGHCDSQTTGDRYTLFVISAPASAAAGLWANYNARLNSLDTDCNTAYDENRQTLPPGYSIVSEEGDVVLH
jgi:hypothetical protein